MACVSLPPCPLTPLVIPCHMLLVKHKDYVYIPLGGNRRSTSRFIFNILIVWLLTGFWHGADWNFIFWGLFHGIVLLIEKFFIGDLVDKLPKWLQDFYVMVIVMVGWVLFDADNLLVAGNRLLRMFTLDSTALTNAESLYYLRSYIFTIIIAIIGSTPLPKRIADKLENKKIMTIIEPLFVGVLLIATTAFIVDGSFNPFIYFRF